MIFVCYPKCSTCMKAKKHLNQLGLAFEERDISRENPTGRLYQSLQLKEKLPTMSEHEMIALLASDGMLVKRPLLIKENQVLVGYRAEAYAALV